MNNNIFTKELDDNILLIDLFDNINYITLLEKYERLKLNEEKLIETNLKLNKTINNLRNINYTTHIKNDILNKKLNHSINTIENLELDIIEMNQELDEYNDIIKKYNIIN